MPAADPMTAAGQDPLATAWYGPGAKPASEATILGTSPPATRGTLPGGTLVAGRYRVGEPLGAGAFAVVCSAWDLSLHRWVALKLYEQGQAGVDPADEVRLQASCQHPNLMPLFDAGADPLLGYSFTVMPLYPGADLAATISRYGPLPFRSATLCTDQICSALDFLWQRRQAVHADVKPANIWLTHSGAALLMDFNVHGLLVRGYARVGTPGYTSPEGLRGEYTPAGDVFSLGCVLYECLAGVRPFADDQAVADGRCLPLHRLRPETRPELAAVVHTALAPSPADRYQSARELQTALRHPPRPRSVFPISGRAVLRILGHVLAGGHRLLWRFLRYACRHPGQALIEVAVVLVGARLLMDAAARWLAAHRTTIAAVGLALACLLVLITAWRWRKR